MAIALSQDQILRNLTLHEAIRAVHRHFPDLSMQAVVERYPTRRAPLGTVDGGVFAYQFFDRNGQNCAYYLKDLTSLHLLAKPRQWGIPKESYYDLRPHLLD